MVKKKKAIEKLKGDQWEVCIGDVFDVLKSLPDSFVQCIVTSPSYWSLRDYGTACWEGGNLECNHKIVDDNSGAAVKSALQGSKRNVGHALEGYKSICGRCGARRVDFQLGLESVPDCLGWTRGENCGECYVCHTRLWAAECWRVLRDDGIFWLNLGDSYNGSGKARGGGGKGPLSGKQKANAGAYFDNPTPVNVPGLKPKNLMMIPARVAMALQADGWWLRSEIIWQKPNVMPSSVEDRPTVSHEYVFLLTKSKNYFYDTEAIKELSVDPESYTGTRRRRAGKMYDLDRVHYTATGSVGEDGYKRSGQVYPTRNKRTVWTIPTHPFRGAHFATFPLDLIDPMILAGTSARGCCPECGAGWVRVIKRTRLTRPELPKDDPRYRPNVYHGSYDDINGKSDAGYTDTITMGWQPGCSCYGVERIQRFTRSKKQLNLLNQYRSLKTDKCIVLDPFAGSGTTLGAAVRRGRKVIGIELNPKYVKELVALRVEELRRIPIKRKRDK